MKRLLLLAFLAFASTAVFAEDFKGYVSDQKCAAHGASAAKASDWVNPQAFPSCAQKCVKAGSPVVFVTDDNKVLKLDADSTKKAMPHDGERVSLSGNVENDTLKIDKIAKIEMPEAKPAKN